MIFLLVSHEGPPWGGIELECLLWEDPKDSVLGREHEEQIQPLGRANKSPPGCSGASWAYLVTEVMENSSEEDFERHGGQRRIKTYSVLRLMNYWVKPMEERVGLLSLGRLKNNCHLPHFKDPLAWSQGLQQVSSQSSTYFYGSTMY